MEWWIAYVLQGLWVLVVAVWIVLERRSATATIAWILALVFLPVVGILIYFFLGPRKLVRRKLRRKRAVESVRSQARVWDRSSLATIGDEAAKLMEMLERSGGAGPTLDAACELYVDGRAKYDAVVAAVDAAQHHVHVEYYIWEPDAVGARLRDALVERAASGIEVRVLIDAFGSKNAGERFWRPLREAGGRVQRFNALKITRWRPRLANFRTHRKIVVVDGRVGFTGGMNVSDVHNEWRDTHLRLEGPAVRGLQAVFNEDWCYACEEVLSGGLYFPKPDELLMGDHGVQVVASGPDENMNAIHKLYFSAIANAKRRALVTSPYFVPDDMMMGAMTTAALRGVDVRVLVPAEGDVRLVAAAARSYYPELLSTGVRIFEYGPSVLHAKTLVVDDHLGIVGTANLDNRSFRLNFEVVAAVFGGRICEELAAAFEQDVAAARELTLDGLSKEPLHRRLFVSTARMLSPVL
jgi:cardiolipin synthase